MKNPRRWNECRIPEVMIPLLLGIAGVCAAANGDPKYQIIAIDPPSTSCAVGVSAMNALGGVTGTACFDSTSGSVAFLWQGNATPMVAIDPNGGEPWAINSSGQVTGWDYGGAGREAFLWKNDGTPVLELGTLGGTNTIGHDINEAGQVAGVTTTGTGTRTRAVIWKAGTHKILDLGTLGGTWAGANAENASGQVTGFAYTSGNSRRAFLWKNDGTPMLNLGTLPGAWSEGLVVNASGQVAGYSRTKRGQTGLHAFFWPNNGKPMIDISVSGGFESQPFAINESGQVVGLFATQSTSSYPVHAFIWKNDGTPSVDLGTFGGTESIAYSINDAGWVTGYATAGLAQYAFLWRDDGKGMRNLNDLIDPADPLKPYVVLTWGLQINDSGDILAYGDDSRHTGVGASAYLLRTSPLALLTHSLAFGNQKAGTMSAAKSITVQNKTTAAVPITTIALAGSGANQFSSTNNCGSSVIGAGHCTIQVTFKPTSTGAKSATLSVNGGGGGLRVVTLTGTGT